MYQLLSKTKAKELKSLSLKKERERQGLFMVEGDKSVIDSLSAFELKYLITTSGWIELHSNLATLYSDKILLADKKGLEIISSLISLPEVIAVFYKPKENYEIPVLDAKKIYVLLDEIQDPGNLGTIIRSCDWFGIYEIFASRTTVDVYSPKVIQAAMGSLSRVRVKYLDLNVLIQKNRDIKVIGTLLTGIPIKEIDLNSGGLLLMGNEGKGISEELKNMIDIPVTIPPVNTRNHPDSLNVAIATAIMLYNLTK